MSGNLKNFSVGRNALSLWIEVVSQAKKSVYIATNKLTSPKATDALISAKQRGLNIRIIVDGKEAKGNELVGSIRASGGDIALWSSDRLGDLHIKLYIIDECIVVFGSFNLSKSAEHKNNELFFRTNDKLLLKSAMQTWNKLWKFAQMKPINEV